MTDVLTALGNRWDSRVATLLETSREVTLARRCADLADLVATASAGVGSVALVSADLRGLDLSTVAQLRDAGLTVVGLTAPGAEEDERRLRQLGVVRVVAGDADLVAFEDVLRRDDADGPPGAPDARGALGALGGLEVLGGRDALAELERDLASGATGSATPGTDVGSGGAVDADLADDPPPGRVVAVWGPTGAPGRTTLAVTLASELAGLGIPTVLVDADTYGGSVAQALSFLDEAPGLAAATRAADQGSLDRALLARLAPLAGPGLRVLTGLPKAERWPEVRPAALERVLEVGRTLGQVVVVDCGFNLEDDEELSYDTVAPRRNAATLTTLAVADELVVVGGCDPVGLQRLVRGLQDLTTLPSPRPTVVVNRVRSSAVGPQPEQRVREALARFAGVHDVLFVPDDPAALDAALLQGRSLTECAPLSPVRAAVRAVAERVAGAPPAGRRRRRGLRLSR